MTVYIRQKNYKNRRISFLLAVVRKERYRARMTVEHPFQILPANCRVPVLTAAAAFRIEQQQDERPEIARQDHEFGKLGLGQ